MFVHRNRFLNKGFRLSGFFDKCFFAILLNVFYDGIRYLA
ncbi:hypothetical protein TFKS16_2535 [Tannerella forsythia KS16]|uniref:Uncharacterized protein n=1 Tax=Tannerella forsythia (strain ATCC 43037 / JCM 10827 / CCUG 21028 A / KCTC 5666 / FDC 338) TaxID=203275 RepID=G8UN91_TANFA|nr:hypothetical protein BFO_2811 [Tannerella forsythia 92A2]BAR49886.1 hypothetical protein TF3313_2447 [Tannerella forsythia 3313]BAR52711.1 hypothetical protein TFKS16_2525 [Tannerella forsythia KS16]AEW21725.1 hypothetical protein BFO_2800 [Tannerella forsythia 92A2]BAR49896.1 hypothetical protein TF3313_2457 [Tannerella forsythia 3313]